MEKSRERESDVGRRSTASLAGEGIASRGEGLCGEGSRRTFPLAGCRIFGAGKRPAPSSRSSLAEVAGALGWGDGVTFLSSSPSSSSAKVSSASSTTLSSTPSDAEISSSWPEPSCTISSPSTRPWRRSSRLIVSPVSRMRFRQPSIIATASRHRHSIFSHPARSRTISSSRASRSSRGTKEGFVRRVWRCDSTSCVAASSTSYDGGVRSVTFGS